MKLHRATILYIILIACIYVDTYIYILNLNYKYITKQIKVNQWLLRFWCFSESPIQLQCAAQMPTNKDSFPWLLLLFLSQTVFSKSSHTHTNTHQSKSWTMAIFNLLSCLLNVPSLRKVKKKHIWVDWGKVVTLQICQGTFLDVSASPARNLSDRWPSHPQSCMMKHGPKDPESMYIQTSDPWVYLQRYTHILYSTNSRGHVIHYDVFLRHPISGNGLWNRVALGYVHDSYSEHFLGTISQMLPRYHLAFQYCNKNKEV